MTVHYGGSTLLAGLLLILFLALFFVFWTLWHQRGRLDDIALRPLSPLEFLRASLRRAAEMGESVHLSPGTGALYEVPGTGILGRPQQSSVAETLAGLEAVQAIAKDSLALGVPVHVTTNDALVNLVAEQVLDQGLRNAGQPPGLQADSWFVAQQEPLTYASGVMDVLGRPDVQGNVLIGAFDDELLLMGEVGSRETTFQVAGAARPASVAFLPIVAREFLLGEEIYAVGAYLDPKPARVVSLLVQDGVRTVLILLIVLGVLLATLGMDGILAPLFQMSGP